MSRRKHPCIADKCRCLSEVHDRSLCESTMTSESVEMSMEACTVYHSIFLPHLSSFSLSSSPSHPSLCVAYCETDGEGKDDRQTEGRREREAENDKVGKWETISRRRETEKQGGSRCVKHKTTLWSLRLVLGWLRSNPRSLSLCTSEAA